MLAVHISAVAASGQVYLGYVFVWRFNCLGSESLAPALPLRPASLLVVVACCLDKLLYVFLFFRRFIASGNVCDRASDFEITLGLRRGGCVVFWSLFLP